MLQQTNENKEETPQEVCFDIKQQQHFLVWDLICIHLTCTHRALNFNSNKNVLSVRVEKLRIQKNIKGDCTKNY